MSFPPFSRLFTAHYKLSMVSLALCSTRMALSFRKIENPGPTFIYAH